ncbi:MAG: hypothetical protein OER21_10990 [Gemmatimonadota bacterium]|nr:hypothetical protein [Gemmatimonadota bacterium]
MQSPSLLGLAALTLGLTGCAILGFGPPTAIVDGWVYAAEDQVPLPNAEVCAFGSDTTCVRADAAGYYRIRLVAQTIVLRFRFGQLPPAVSDTVRVEPPLGQSVSCAISNRLVLADDPLPCLRVIGR